MPDETKIARVMGGILVALLVVVVVILVVGTLAGCIRSQERTNPADPAVATPTVAP